MHMYFVIIFAICVPQQKNYGTIIISMIPTFKFI